MFLINVLLFVSFATAFSLPDLSSFLPLFTRDKGGGGSNSGSGGGGNGQCPQVWNDVSKELTQKFYDKRTVRIPRSLLHA